MISGYVFTGLSLFIMIQALIIMFNRGDCCDCDDSVYNAF